MNSAAFFDVDGTLVDRTIVDYYIYFRKRLMSPVQAVFWHPLYLLKCVAYLLLDAVDRNRFNRVFYADYRGLPAEKTKSFAADCFRDVIRSRVFPGAREAVAEHVRGERQIVLVTGSLDFIMRPVAEDFRSAELIAASLVESNGLFTGRLTGPPIGHEEKARRILEFAANRGIDLDTSYAYGDSVADLPMLETVGFPNAVNPDGRLRKIAEARGWPVHRWTLSEY